MKSILQQVIKFSTPAVLEKFSNVLGWVHSERDNWILRGYYDQRYNCNSNFVPRDEEYHRSNHFVISIVFYNIILSVGILICYILVTIKIYENDKFRFVPYKFCAGEFCCRFTKCLCNDAFFQHQDNPVVGSRSAENLRMLKRITVIVFTDLICWIPICVTSLVIWQHSAEITFQIRMLIQTAVTILVPLNSIINPYIYSFHLWGRLLKKLGSRCNH